MKIEELAKDLAESNDVDPYKKSVGIGNLIPVGQEYELWEAYLKQSKILFEKGYRKEKNNAMV